MKDAGTGFFINHNFFDSGGGWSAVAPGKHFIYVRVIAFKDSLYAAVGYISNPAGKIETNCRALSFRAEKYSLHSAFNINMDAFHKFICQ
jgi:hypothetical protein